MIEAVGVVDHVEWVDGEPPGCRVCGAHMRPETLIRVHCYGLKQVVLVMDTGKRIRTEHPYPEFTHETCLPGSNPIPFPGGRR